MEATKTAQSQKLSFCNCKIQSLKILFLEINIWQVQKSSQAKCKYLSSENSNGKYICCDRKPLQYTENEMLPLPLRLIFKPSVLCSFTDISFLHFCTLKETLSKTLEGYIYKPIPQAHCLLHAFSSLDFQVAERNLACV